jgi:hypothetical protein
VEHTAKINSQGRMINAVKFATSVLALATACLAQEGLTIDNKHKERMSTPEAEKIYFSACSVVEEEFVINHPILPRVKLVLGANKNVVVWAEREIWPYEMGTAICSHRGVSCWPLPISDRGPQNRNDPASRELGRFNCGNRTTCKIAGWLATAEAVASSRAT